IRRFAVDAAHELRTPLTVLKGGIEVALRADRDPREYRDVLRSSLEEVEQLIALAENLLLLSRLRMSTSLPRHAVELETVLMEAVDTGVRLADGRGVIVRLDAARGSEVVGAGLGLSIVHSIVLAHDGNLSVQTALGVGSTFAIRLPLA